MRKCRRLIAVLLVLFTLSTFGHCLADVLTINIPATYGVSDAIVTLDCYINCSDLDSTNFYIAFDRSELSFQGLYQNNIPEIQYQSGFRILSNVINDPGLLNEKGIIGVVMFDENGIAQKNYFNAPKCLFTIQFKIMKDITECISLNCLGKGALRTAVLSSGFTGTCQNAEKSGTIMMLEANENDSILNIPQMIRSVEEEAFAQSGVNTVIAQEGLESLGARAFADCSFLRDTYLPNTLSSIAEDAFDNCKELIIHCADDSQAEAYAKSHRIPYIITIN